MKFSNGPQVSENICTWNLQIWNFVDRKVSHFTVYPYMSHLYMHLNFFTPVKFCQKCSRDGCGKHAGCQEANCGSCKKCLDMKCFDGPGMKQNACQGRKCTIFCIAHTEIETNTSNASSTVWKHSSLVHKHARLCLSLIKEKLVLAETSNAMHSKAYLSDGILKISYYSHTSTGPYYVYIQVTAASCTVPPWLLILKLHDAP